MIRSKSIACVGLVVLIATAGCSSGGSSDSVFNQNDFDAVMSQIVIPAPQLLNPFAATVALARAAADAPAAAPGGTSCPEDLSSTYCDTGQACRAPSTGGTTLTFTDCVAQGVTINGTWIVVGTPDNNTSTLDITVSVPFLLTATLQGTIVTSPGAGGCLTEDFTGLSVQAASTSILVDGLLTYCSASSWPTGSRELTITDGTSDYLYLMTLNGTNQALTTVKDKSSGNTLATCSTNLDTAVSNCTPI